MEFGIYQLRQDCDNRRDKMFSSMDMLRRMGYEKPSKDDYQCVWRGNVDPDSRGDEYVLDNLFGIFNSRHPINYTGHSMSVSDVVELDGKFYYCDSIGWIPLEDF